MWQGRIDPYHAIVLIERLTTNPQANVYGVRLGNRAMQGWDTNTILLARLNNLIAGFMSGFSKGKPNADLFIEAPSPGEVEAPVEEEPQMTIAQFSGARFSKWMYD